MLTGSVGLCQNSMDIKAGFDLDNDEVHILQEITYRNDSKDSLRSIYLSDWSNSYSSKSSPLARRFAEEYNNNFHLAKRRTVDLLKLRRSPIPTTQI